MAWDVIGRFRRKFFPNIGFGQYRSAIFLENDITSSHRPTQAMPRHYTVHTDHATPLHSSYRPNQTMPRHYTAHTDRPRPCYAITQLTPTNPDYATPLYSSPVRHVHHRIAGDSIFSTRNMRLPTLCGRGASDDPQSTRCHRPYHPSPIVPIARGARDGLAPSGMLTAASTAPLAEEGDYHTIHNWASVCRQH